MFKNSSPLTRVKLSFVISNLLKLCNIEGDYTGHSLHIGAASSAARVGVSDNMIKTLRRWSTKAYRLYIRSSEDNIAKVSKKNFCNFLSVNLYATLSDFVNLGPPVYGISRQVSSVTQSTNQVFNHSINQSVNQSVNQTINQSVNQLINQSINQSIAYVHFNKSFSHFGLNMALPGFLLFSYSVSNRCFSGNDLLLRLLS